MSGSTWECEDGLDEERWGREMAGEPGPTCDGCGREVPAEGDLCPRCTGTRCPDDTDDDEGGAWWV